MTTATATKTVLRYDLETCSRCGGSGTYSYCQMYGTTCFKCRGQKKSLSRAGKKASEAVRAFIAKRFSVPVESLQAGDRITYDGRARTVASVTTEGGGRYGIGTDANGQTIWEDYITVTFTVPINAGFGPVTGHGFCKGHTVVKAVAGADWDAVVEFARTIKRGVTIETT